jgi:4-nitrophenyl phosphatase
MRTLRPTTKQRWRAASTIPDAAPAPRAAPAGTRHYSGVVIDLDGVCYRGDTAVPGSRDAVARLRAAGVAVVFATNNATRTRAQAAEKLIRLGFPAEPKEIVTSAVAAADLIAPGTRCMVIGAHGLREAVRDRGCVLVDDPATTEVVVTGLDRQITYEMLTRGTRALLAGARFVASNADPSFPDVDGISPGAGAIMAALETASGVRAEVAGKPRPALFEAAAARLPHGRLLMIGDRVETDIHGAAALGWDTGLVLTGVTDADAARRAAPPPTYVAGDLATLVRDVFGTHT